MAALSDASLAGICVNAGWRGNDLTIAVAVALAESGGNPRAHNGNAATGDDSYGLFQINMIGDMGPARRKQYGLPNNEALYDPTTNARVAFALYKSQGFRPWTTFTRGAYLRYMPRATAAVKANGGASVATGTVGGATGGASDRPDTPLPDSIENTIYDLRDAVTGVSSFVGWITNKDNWLRVGMFAGGAILVIVGVVMYVKSTSAAQAAANVATSVTKVAV